MVVRKYFFAGIILSVMIISLIGVASAVNNDITYGQSISLREDATSKYMSANDDFSTFLGGLKKYNINANRGSVEGDSELYYIRGKENGAAVSSGDSITLVSIKSGNSLKHEADLYGDYINARSYNDGGGKELNVKILKDDNSAGVIKCGDWIKFEVEGKSGKYWDVDRNKEAVPSLVGGYSSFFIFENNGDCTSETGPITPPAIPINPCNHNKTCDAILGENFRNCADDCPVVKINCTEDSQTIMRLSENQNAHGALWNENYPISICYGNLFTDSYEPAAGEDPHVCKPDGTNTVLSLSGETNAHASNTTSAKYATQVCYGNLNCRSTTGICNEDEKNILSLYSPTNSQISIGNNEAIKICCKSVGTTPLGPVCGNNIIEIGEQCDNSTLPKREDGKTIECSNIDKCTGGSVKCTNCRLDISECTGCNGTATEFCGDGAINNFYEQCDWNGPQLGGFNCLSFGLPGNLGCFNSSSPRNCTFDTSTCAPLCGVGTTFCKDMVCRANCTLEGFNCNENGVCDIGEGCECWDCHGVHDSCNGTLTCNFRTDTCEVCPAGTTFDNTTNVNPVLQSCSPYNTNLSIIITKPVKGTGSENWPKFTTTQEIEFNQIATSAFKDVSVIWEFGDGNTTTLKNCLTTNNCNINHTYASRGHYTVRATANEQGGTGISAPDSVDILVYGPGINPFAVISNPKPGENTSASIFFNASASFISNCSVSTSTCASVCDGIGNLCCCNLPLPGRNGEPGYKFWFNWVLFETGTTNYTLLGTWNNNYSQVVEFNWSFINLGSHTATLKVGYEA
jgi:hypothetical protein